MPNAQPIRIVGHGNERLLEYLDTEGPLNPKRGPLGPSKPMILVHHKSKLRHRLTKSMFEIVFEK